MRIADRIVRQIEAETVRRRTVNSQPGNILEEIDASARQGIGIKILQLIELYYNEAQKELQNEASAVKQDQAPVESVKEPFGGQSKARQPKGNVTG